jgi:hypothetical protein
MYFFNIKQIYMFEILDGFEIDTVFLKKAVQHLY